jgi:hypothetical protein
MRMRRSCVPDGVLAAEDREPENVPAGIEPDRGIQIRRPATQPATLGGRPREVIDEYFGRLPLETPQKLLLAGCCSGSAAKLSLQQPNRFATAASLIRRTSLAQDRRPRHAQCQEREPLLLETTATPFGRERGIEPPRHEEGDHGG